jgi:hypothetical protein
MKKIIVLSVSFVLLLAALAISIDFSTTGGISMMFANEKKSSFFSPFVTLAPSLPARAQFLIDGDQKCKDYTAKQRSILDSDPNNKIFYANYILAAMAKQKKADAADIETLLLKAQIFEPENSFYNYLLAAFWARKAIDQSDYKNTRIIDAEMAKKALIELKKASAKPYFNSYCSAMLQLKVEALGPIDNMGILVQRIYVAASSLLPALADYRTIGRLSIAYGNLLGKNGDKPNADFCYDLWQDLLPKMNNNAFTLIEQLVIGAIAKINLEAAQQRCDIARIAQLENTAAIIINFKARAQFFKDPNLNKHAGIMANMLLPVVGEKISIEEAYPELRINYTIFDHLCLALTTLFTLILTFCLTIRLLRKKAEFSQMQWQDYLKSFALGIVLPVTLFLLLTHINLLSGRNFAINHNVFRTVLLAGFLVMLLPLCVDGAFRYFYRKKFNGDAMTLNLIPFLAVSIFIVAILLRGWLHFEQKYWFARDTILKSSVGFTAIEDRVVERLKLEHQHAFDTIIPKKSQ